MNMVKVESSNIDAIGYEPAKKELRIRFKSGQTYKYTPVTQKGYEDFLSADSKGKYFHKNIKDNATLSFEKV